ncbi:MAG: hypothetical protein H0X62_03710 [Bacteroidetes bacterium]|nr:hypothetical protein [Bacteroidota bacterium]
MKFIIIIVFIVVFSGISIAQVAGIYPSKEFFYNKTEKNRTILYYEDGKIKAEGNTLQDWLALDPGGTRKKPLRWVEYYPDGRKKIDHVFCEQYGRLGKTDFYNSKGKILAKTNIDYRLFMCKYGHWYFYNPNSSDIEMEGFFYLEYDSTVNYNNLWLLLDSAPDYIVKYYTSLNIDRSFFPISDTLWSLSLYPNGHKKAFSSKFTSGSENYACGWKEFYAYWAKKPTKVFRFEWDTIGNPTAISARLWNFIDGYDTYFLFKKEYNWFFERVGDSWRKEQYRRDNVDNLVPKYDSIHVIYNNGVPVYFIGVMLNGMSKYLREEKVIITPEMQEPFLKMPAFFEEQINNFRVKKKRERKK